MAVIQCSSAVFNPNVKVLYRCFGLGILTALGTNNTLKRMNYLALMVKKVLIQEI